MTDQLAALRIYNRDAIRSALTPADAVAAVHAALAAGLDPAAGQPRTAMPLTHGEFLMMPAEFGAHTGVKVLTVAPHNPERNLPRVQGVYILFDAETGTPTALLDGSELTALRTAAVSLAAVRDRLLADQNPMRVVVFGAGTQARSHLRTLFAVIEGRRSLADLVVAVRRPQDETAARLADGLDVPGTVVGIGTGAADRAVADADLIMCTTGSDEPLFDGTLVRDGATIICVGAHEPHAREVDDELIARSFVMVEDPATALREVGAVISARAAGRFDSERLIPLTACADLDVGGATSPLVFISVGMSWEDLVIASAVAAAIV
jgi:ornithine cyclodeaminase/alanine dehydrogenase-like protein (mu-crystallin family)